MSAAETDSGGFTRGNHADGATVPRSGAIVWTPSPDYLKRSRLLAFMRDNGVPDYDTLLHRSTTEPEWYWAAVVNHLGVDWYRPYDRVLDLSNGIEWPRWFPGARYNYVHDALDKRAAGDDRDMLAVTWEGDDGAIRRLSFGELTAMTNRLAGALAELGVGQGDRV